MNFPQLHFFKNPFAKIILPFLISIVVYFISIQFLSDVESRFIAVTLYVVTLWTNEGLPLGVVSLLPLFLFPTLEILDLKIAAPKYSHPIIFLFLGGFFLAIAVEKTGLHKYLSARLLSIFPKSATGLIYAVMFTSAFLSAVLSNTTVTLMLYPTVIVLSSDHKLKVKLLLATAYGASIGGVLTPMGTPPNLYLLGFLEDRMVETPSFIGWMWMMAPVVGGMLLVAPFLLSFTVRSVAVTAIDSDIKVLSGDQRKLLWILGSLVVLLVSNSEIKPYYGGLGLNEKLILLGYGLLMFIPGVNMLEWEDVKKVPFDILFLFGGGFVIAEAFISSGLTDSIVSHLDIVSSLSMAVLFFVVALIVSFSTEITSNTAFVSISVPILFRLAAEYQLDNRVLIVATIAASYAFMLPIATPPNAIVMSGGYIKIKEMAKSGFIINFTGVIVLSVVSFLLW